MTNSLTLSDRQALHHARKTADGFQRVSAYLTPGALATVARVVDATGLSRQDALNFLLDDTMDNDEITPEIALQLLPEKARSLIRQQFIASGAIRDGITPAEQAELDAFKNQLAESNVTARQLQAHGGQAALDTQNRIAASMLHANVHNQK